MLSSTALRLRFFNGIPFRSQKIDDKSDETSIRSFLVQKNGVSFFAAYLFPAAAILSASLAVLATPADSARADLGVMCSLLGAIYAFVLIPMFDYALGLDVTNTERPSHGFYRMLVRLYVPVTFVMLWTVTHILFTYKGFLSIPAIIGSVISLGISNAMSFTVAHELLHSSERVEQLLSFMLLVPNFYTHWIRAHLQHHAWVGTDRDPTTARKNETVYAFWVRSIYGNLVNAYAAESRKKSKRTLIKWIISPLLLLWVNYMVYGIFGVSVQIGQAFVSILMLETVNYIEHYGLTRSKIGSVYERVQPKHSWNATTIFTNATSFNLQRHSDHHAHERKSYETLEHFAGAPQLPMGYPAMMLMSLVPSLYFKTMNPLLTSTVE